MKTWKQGRIGKMEFSDSCVLYLKCLKYPLAEFYSKYDDSGKLEGFLFEANLEISALKSILVVGQVALSKDEKMRESPVKTLYDLKNIKMQSEDVMKIK